MDEKSDGSAPVDIKKADSPPRLLTLVHEAIRRKYYSRRTEEAYVHWIKRFIYFHGKRHPRDMGEAELTAFLNDLASVRNVAGGTQNQALSALLFLYKEVLGKDLAWLDGLVRAKRPPRLPTVLTQAEAEALLAQLTGVRWLLVSLLYGAGLRVMECLRLRVKDVDLEYRQVLVRDGKGEKDRVTMLPQKLVEPLRAHLQRVRGLHARDLKEGFGEVNMPYALSRKYPRAAREWFGGSRRRGDAASSSVRVGAAARGARGGARRRHREARELPHAAPFVRHPPARGRLRHQDRAGTAWALGRLDHHDLYACPQ